MAILIRCYYLVSNFCFQLKFQFSRLFICICIYNFEDLQNSCLFPFFAIINIFKNWHDCTAIHQALRSIFLRSRHWHQRISPESFLSFMTSHEMVLTFVSLIKQARLGTVLEIYYMYGKDFFFMWDPHSGNPLFMAT